ncbi:MAG: class I SAM-dependent methyltransferase [Bryobacteraceae bacterium]
MPLSRDLARRKRCEYFLPRVRKDACILEIGCAAHWLGDYLKGGGWKNYVGIDLIPPADIVGDIKQWASLGLTPESFDVIIAFEVIEHVDLVRETFELLKPGGLLMLTSPVPHLDWVMWTLEMAGLNQKRTSPHSNLVYFSKLPLFELAEYERVGGLLQFGILRKPVTPRRA